MSVCFARRTLVLGAAAGAFLTAVPPAFAQLSIEITGVGANRIPVAVLGFRGSQELGFDLSKIVAMDLMRTGSFEVTQSEQTEGVGTYESPNLSEYRGQGIAALCVGSAARLADGTFDIRYRLFDTAQGAEIASANFVATAEQLRMTAHRIADDVYDKLTGMGKLFASRLAYVVKYADDRFELIVADSDGANARVALRSREPIISPAWSPDGSQLAYVSFEDKKPVVYVHTIATGKRRLLSNFPGNNSAPAFSPDGKKLAIALSRSGFTQIFLINADGTNTSRLTRSLAIDTEPVFSADGKYLYFTSDRGGSAQIYRQDLMQGSGNPERVTFNGNYAVSPAINRDGTTLAYIARTADRRYCVTVMDVATGQEMIISKTDRDESPSFSPNGRMIVFATERSSAGVLACISVDGKTSSFLSASSGDIREPTWGPILSD